MSKRLPLPAVLVLLSPCLVVLGLVGMMLGSSQRDDCAPGNDSATTTQWAVPMAEGYRVTSPYGWRIHPVHGGRRMHYGIDLASSSGHSPVLAVTAGTVARISNDSSGYGIWIELNHGTGLASRYAHLSSAAVKIGDAVVAGQRIGTEGATGGVTGPHLHFELRINGAAVDPAPEMARRNVPLDGTPAKTDTTTDTPRPAVSLAQIDHVIPSPAGIDRSSQLSERQRATAAVIIEEGMRQGLPPRAWAIALAVALQESTLGADTSTLVPNADGDVGVFQQRAKVGWYADGATMAENTAILNDVTTAARTFYRGHDVGIKAAGAAGPLGYHIPGLVDIPDWESKPIWQAAQAVQVSAFPTAYAKHEATVRGILATVGVNAINYECPTGDTTLDPGTPVGDQVVAHALTQLGVPYSWGGGNASGPTRGTCCSPGGHSGTSTIGFDCSGLTLWAWAQVGVTLPHQSAAQQRATTPVNVADLQAGDLLFFPGHVGIYDGKGGMIEAPRTGVPVRVTPNVLTHNYYGPRLTGIGRPASTPPR